MSNTTPSSFWKTVRNNLKLQRKAPAILPANRSQVLPLSLGQQRLWQLEQLHIHNTVHNLRAAFRLQGELNVAVLEKSLQAIVQRHEILRTEFLVRNSQASQVILPELTLTLPVILLEQLTAAEQEKAVIDYAHEEAQVPFNLACAPLLRVKLLRLSATEHVLLRTTHHIVYDLWSDSVFMRELALLYCTFLQDQPSSLPELPIQYVDCAVFQQQHLEMQSLLAYWQQQLAGYLPLLKLPVDHIANFDYRGETEYCEVSAELTQKLSSFASQQGTALFAVLLTAFNVLLYQYSQQEDMLLCSPVAGRYRVETKKLIGFFNNLVLLRCDLSNDPSFSELLARIGQVILDANTHQDLPLQALADSLNIPANLLSRAMFTLQNVPSMPQTMADIAVTRLDIEQGIANFDLSLSIREKADGLIAIACYKTGLFDRSTIQQLLTRFTALLADMSDEPQTRLSQLPRFAYRQIAPSQTAAYIAPLTELEKTIAQIWQDVLQVQQVGLSDDFFSMGGSSLAMLQVSRQLETRLNRSCAIVELFKQPTVSAMANYLSSSENMPESSLDIDAVKQYSTRRKNALNRQKNSKPGASALTENANADALIEPLAIIGMSGRFPGAKNCEEFWQNLSNGIESIEFFSDEEALASGADPELIGNPHFVKAHGVLKDVEYFDAGFFNMSPREARILDPQHRVFLETAWEAMENAGYDSDKYDGQVGVYGGTGFSTYLLRNILPNNLVRFQTIERLEMALANHNDSMPMRVSFHMNLTGPSICVGTTCATSLVAVHLACQGLLSYQCDMALAGASYIRTPAKEGYLYQEGMIWSPDGHIRAFDADAKGIVVGSGVGVVVIKRLADALVDGDTVQAVIKATALNNDGSAKISYTAPSISGQAKVIAEAIDLAGIGSDSVSYLETHGTGTELGDVVEVAAMTQAFNATAIDPRTQKRQYCAMGSVKPNIGHLHHAAAIAGLIKTVLAIKHKQLPPSLNFNKPNPKIDFENSPFYVNTRLQDWDTGNAPRRAGVNALGIGGTNCHVIIEEAPPAQLSSSARPHQLLMLCAKTQTALDKTTGNLAQHLSEHPQLDLADVAFTLHMGRKAFDYRRIVVADTVDEAIERLHDKNPHYVFDHYQKSATHPIAFMFPGQGAQYVNMAKEIYQTEAVFKQQLDYCADYLKPLLNVDLRALLYPATLSVEEASGQLQQTAITQAALFSVEYALAQLWMSWGVKPKAMIGHSIGEYVAACIAGVFSLDDGLSLVAARGQLMQSLSPGNMLAVSLPAEDLRQLLPEDLSLALINSSSLCVVSGTGEAINAFASDMKDRAVHCQILHTSHAFHSQMMESIVEPFTARMRQTVLNAPKIPYLSNVTGTWISAEQATDPNYWAQHLRQTVHFSEGLEQLFLDRQHILLEVGPGRTLSSLARQHQAKKTGQWVLTSLPHPQENQADAAFLLTTLGRLWLAGLAIDHKAFYAGRKLHRTELPTYPFERQRYWIDAPKHGQSNAGQPQGSLSRLNLLDENRTVESESVEENIFFAPRNANELALANIWKDVLGADRLGIHDNFFECGGSSLVASIVVARIYECLGTELSISEFLNAPTIAELALLLSAEVPEIGTGATPDTASANTRRCLVKIKGGDEARPILFLVHPIDGDVTFYRDLAQDLPAHQAVYAFQANGLSNGAQVLTEVELMAAVYLEEMLSKQSHGPYLLGGTSFGGIVAFEMARQLQQAHEAVKLLFMIDSPAPGQNVFNSEKESDILSFIARHLLKMDDKAPSSTELETLTTEQQINTVLEQAKKLDCVTGSFEAEQLQCWLTVFKANSLAMSRYQPQDYAGHLTFFRAQQPWSSDKPGHPEHFWIEKAQQGIDIYNITGTHITMNRQPQVGEIAQKLIRYF